MEAVHGTAEVGAGRVSSSADAGPGSFRQAVLDANADPSIGAIRFEGGLEPIRLVTPVTYSGGQDLVIRAGGAVLDGRRLGAGESAFVADGGGNLTISELSVSRAPGNGITVKVPDAATGTFHVRLEDVVIRNNGLHGILINDQAEYFDDPASTSEEGSAAGLLVEVVRQPLRAQRILADRLRRAEDQRGRRRHAGGARARHPVRQQRRRRARAGRAWRR